MPATSICLEAVKDELRSVLQDLYGQGASCQQIVAAVKEVSGEIAVRNDLISRNIRRGL